METPYLNVLIKKVREMIPSENINQHDIINNAERELNKLQATSDRGKHELKLLQEIAYCAAGMKDCENEQNFGESTEWKRHLYNKISEYRDHGYDAC